MTDSKETGGKTLSAGGAKTLGVKRGGDAGMVRQSFSHGRTKPVVVEKKRVRVGPTGKPEPEKAAPAAAPPVAAGPSKAEALRADKAKKAAERAARNDTRSDKED